jgi:hypothetical protein
MSPAKSIVEDSFAQLRRKPKKLRQAIAQRWPECGLELNCPIDFGPPSATHFQAWGLADGFAHHEAGAGETKMLAEMKLLEHASNVQMRKQRFCRRHTQKTG